MRTKILKAFDHIGEELLHLTSDLSKDEIAALDDLGIEYMPREDGKAGGTLKKVSESVDFFKPSEFACHCCGKGTVHSKVHKALNKARAIAGIPFIITSGYRCKKHNADVGGSLTSSHMKRYAVDISAKDSQARFRILLGLIHADFNRIGIGKDFIHADMDPNKAQEVVWLY